jgi:hypothetical protein
LSIFFIERIVSLTIRPSFESWLGNGSNLKPSEPTRRSAPASRGFHWENNTDICANCKPRQFFTTNEASEQAKSQEPKGEE